MHAKTMSASATEASSETRRTTWRSVMLVVPRPATVVSTRSRSRKRRCTVFDRRLAHRGPHTVAVEQVHPRTAGERIPAGALEQREQCRLVQMAVRVAFVWVNGQLDRPERRHGARSGWGTGTANVCQNTTRCTLRVPRCRRNANAFAP